MKKTQTKTMKNAKTTSPLTKVKQNKNKASKKIPSKSELKERRFKNFVRTGLDATKYMLYKMGIKKLAELDPIEKKMRTRETFENVESAYALLQEQVKKNMKLVSDFFFNGNQLEVLKDKDITRLKRHYILNHKSLEQLAKDFNIRKDTVAFYLAGGASRSLKSMGAEAMMFTAIIKQNPALYETGFKTFMNEMSLHFSMKRLFEQDANSAAKVSPLKDAKDKKATVKKARVKTPKK